MLKVTHMGKIIVWGFVVVLLSACGGQTGEANSTTSVESNQTTQGEQKATTSTQNDTNTSTEKTNSSTQTEAPVLQSLKLTVGKTSLNKDENTTVKIEATYADNSTKVLTNVEWVVTPKESLEVNGTTLTAKKDNNVTLRAKVGTTLSNTVTLNITWIVDGYVLPPEPDKALNDSTLLGIDSNNNGVRDDVERYIYERFMKDPEYPKTKTALAMQDAWATQKILENPTIESKKYLDDAIDCQYYWFSIKQEKEHNEIIRLSKNDFSESVSLSIKSRKWRSENNVFDDIKLKDIKLNTRARILRKFKFNEACSGHIFRGRKKSIENCQTNIDILGE